MQGTRTRKVRSGYVVLILTEASILPSVTPSAIEPYCREWMNLSSACQPVCLYLTLCNFEKTANGVPTLMGRIIVDNPEPMGLPSMLSMSGEA